MFDAVRNFVGRIVAFGRAWVERFFDVQGFDRAMALSAQAFSALIPIMIVYSAVIPRHEGQDLADSIIERFDLTGSAAATVHETFGTTQTVTDSVTVLSILFIVISALSFSRGMQRLYEGSYGFPALGLRNSARGLAWIGLIIVYVTVRPIIAGLVDTPQWKIGTSLGLAFAAWITTPYLMLGKRLAYRALVPGALLASLGMTAYAVSSLIWFPASISGAASQFGAIGVAFALLSWLFGAGVVIVVAATGGAVVNDQLAVRHR